MYVVTATRVERHCAVTLLNVEPKSPLGSGGGGTRGSAETSAEGQHATHHISAEMRRDLGYVTGPLTYSAIFA